MMKRIFYSLLPCLTLILSACGPSGVQLADNIRDAEQALARGDMKAAQSAGDYLLGTENYSHLSATQLARLSMVYMQLADSVDQPANLDKATDLYDLARKLDADSAAEFYNNLPPDQLQYYATMAERSATRIAPPSFDSIPDENEAANLNIDTLP